MVDPFKATILATLVTFGAQERPRRGPLPDVISVEIVMHSPLTIKPCQRVNIQIELEVDRAITLPMWARLVRSMHEIIESIDELPVMMFLIGPTNHQWATPETVSLIASLARKDTSYKRMLSLAVGMGWRAPPLPPDVSDREFRGHGVKRAREVYGC